LLFQRAEALCSLRSAKAKAKAKAKTKAKTNAKAKAKADTSAKSGGLVAYVPIHDDKACHGWGIWQTAVATLKPYLSG
jgi:hypothetical protein